MASVLTGSAEHAEHAKQGGRAAWGCRAEAQHTRQLTHAKCLWDTALGTRGAACHTRGTGGWRGKGGLLPAPLPCLLSAPLGSYRLLAQLPQALAALE